MIQSNNDSIKSIIQSNQLIKINFSNHKILHLQQVVDSPMTSEEVINEMIQSNQLIPKGVLVDILQENKNLPTSIIAEIPMVKEAIEYNFKHEDDIIQSQLDRIPTPFR